MATWAPALKDTVAALSDEILGIYGTGRTIVGVDGSTGAGASDFADALADAMRLGGTKVFRASITDFLKPADRRNSEGNTAPEYFADAFDYSVFRRILIDPFRASGSTGFVLAAFDAKRGTPIEPRWMTAGKDAVLIVDGVFLQRPELAGLWNYSIWVDAPSTGAASTEVEADSLYIDEFAPRGKAVAIIDNRDPEHPRRVFADAC